MVLHMAAEETSEPTFDELLAWSLDAEPALLPYLPALFADLEELGARAADVIEILTDAALPEAPRILDLGFGKGAVARALLEAMPECTVHGIDGMEEFVTHAEQAAAAAGHGERSVFAVGDIRRAVQQSRDYDLVCFLALGDMLGTADEAVASLRECVRPGGYMLIDDAYLREGATVPEDVVGCYDHETTLALLTHLGDEVIAERIIDGPEARTEYESMTARIAARAESLAQAHPEDAALLRGYVARQEEEVEVLTGPLVGALWLLRRPAD